MARVALFRPVVLSGLLLGSGSFAGEAPPTIVSTEIVETSALVRTLRVALRGAAPIEVEYWTDDGRRLRVSSASARAHAIALARLRAGRTYQYRVVNTGMRGTFRTDPLPSDLAAVRVRASGTPTVPLALVHLYDKEKFKGYVIVDDQGEVVWFWRTKDFPFGMARRRNGNFVFMDKGRGIVEVTAAGGVVRELPQESPEREMHHDLITTPADTVLYLAFDTQEVGGARVKGEAIWEWSPDSGTLIKRWRSWDHLSPTLDRGPRFGGEWMHANSLAIGPRGNILVSVHYLNQILSLAPDWSAIEWRLGGVRATITVPHADQFSGQHTAHELQPGRVLLFDNGRDRGGYSRAVEFVVADGVATKVWAWQPARANFASAVSSARRLDNGNTLIAFGMSAGQSDATGPTEAFEVTPAGTPLWHLVVSGTTTMFRVEPITSIAGER
jgi:Arylsulfotransferase (ASST)